MKVYAVLDTEGKTLEVFDSFQKAKNHSLENAKEDPCFIPEIDDIKFVCKEVCWPIGRYCIFEISKGLCEVARFYIKEFEVK